MRGTQPRSGRLKRCRRAVRTLRGAWQHGLVWFVFYLACFLSPSSVVRSLLLSGGLTVLSVLWAGLAATAWRTAMYTGFAGMMLAFGGAYAQYFREMNVISADLVRALAQSDLREAIGYVRLAGSAQAVIGPLATAAFLALTFPRKGASKHVASLGIVRVIAAAALASVATYVGAQAKVQPLVQALVLYGSEVATLKDATEWRNGHGAIRAASRLEGDLIVIIGESTSRWHMGIYGYHRDTTPRLHRRGDAVIRYEDVIAGHSHTIPSLTGALTLAGSTVLAYTEPRAFDIVSVARHAGFRTYWLSNQNEYGMWDAPIALIGKNADHTRFFSPSAGSMYRRLLPDDTMLPAIAEALAPPGGRRVIFVHLFTSHWPYCDLCPRSFNAFTGALGRQFTGAAAEPPKINAYDNAIRYVDFLVDSIIDMAARRETPTAVVYFSDHGEAPLLDTGHNADQHSSYHLEVPLLLYLNSEFSNRYPMIEKRARAARTVPYSLNWLFHTLADLMMIEAPFVEAEKSLFAAAPQPNLRTALHGTIRYDEWSAGNDYRENARAEIRRMGPLGSRIWAGPVTSLGMAFEAKHIFSGLAVRITGQRELTVAGSVGNALGLDTLLASLDDRPTLGLLLQFDGIPRRFSDAAVAELVRLGRRHDLAGRAVVAAANLSARHAGLLRAEGYRVSCLLEAARGWGATGVANAATTARSCDALTYHGSEQSAAMTHTGYGRYLWADVDSSSQFSAAAAALLTGSPPLDALLVWFPSVFAAEQR